MRRLGAAEAVACAFGSLGAAAAIPSGSSGHSMVGVVRWESVVAGGRGPATFGALFAGRYVEPVGEPW